MAYQKFISDHGFSVVKNGFLMPIEEDEIIDKGGTRMQMLENLGLHNIKVRFIPAKMVFDHYLSGIKMDIVKLCL